MVFHRKREDDFVVEKELLEPKELCTGLTSQRCEVNTEA